MRYIVTIEPVKEPEPKQSVIQSLALMLVVLIRMGFFAVLIIALILIIANAG